jgi:hypothetical protein
VSPSKAKPSLKEQLACAKRELALRRRVYPTFVAAKRMNVFKAEEEMDAMAAIVTTLQELVDRETPKLP